MSESTGNRPKVYAGGKQLRRRIVTQFLELCLHAELPDEPAILVGERTRVPRLAEARLRGEDPSFTAQREPQA